MPKFLSASKIELFLITVLIVTAAFFRFWQIRDYVVFLGDEGRDMLVMRKMIIEKRPVFLGPTASVGGFYLGPIYYWMAAPFLALSRFDPVGPSYMVAGLGVATVFLLLKFLRETTSFWPAFLASSLYATAPLIVRYSRSSWNPNPLPFFALLLIYFLYLGIKKNQMKYFLFAGLSFGIAIQLHYLAIMLVPVAFLIILLNTDFRTLIKSFIFSLIGSSITFAPFLLFEIKHNFPNFKTIWEFVTRPSTHGFRIANITWIISNFGNIFLEEITAFKESIITKIVFNILTFTGIYALVKHWRTPQKLTFSIGIIWFLGGLTFLRFYSGQIFDYYFGFLFPAPFFLFGLIFFLAWKNIILRLSALAITVIILAYFVTNSFYRFPPNRLIMQTEQVADFVIEKSQQKPFNFALITDHNSDHAYRYFLEIKGHKSTDLETLVTDQLLVVCEGQSETNKCAPLGHPIWEIAGFGRAEIEGEWTLPDIGIKVFRLTHWPGAPSPAGKPAVKGK